MRDVFIRIKLNRSDAQVGGLFMVFFHLTWLGALASLCCSVWLGVCDLPVSLTPALLPGRAEPMGLGNLRLMAQSPSSPCALCCVAASQSCVSDVFSRSLHL